MIIFGCKQSATAPAFHQSEYYSLAQQAGQTNKNFVLDIPVFLSTLPLYIWNVMFVYIKTSGTE